MWWRHGTGRFQNRAPFSTRWTGRGGRRAVMVDVWPHPPIHEVSVTFIVSALLQAARRLRGGDWRLLVITTSIRQPFPRLAPT
ncbi:hypothetical protein E2C01_070732 [Portunus trituberculatus]|uniref:Uncharacterized protein n=1 Tax=Portunus trituberculatus TaxID=210409 RepID=A0A5B7HY36_PORTR|nr:hypothetical protein [Portunus trituberculatus]